MDDSEQVLANANVMCKLCDIRDQRFVKSQKQMRLRFKLKLYGLDIRPVLHVLRCSLTYLYMQCKLTFIYLFAKSNIYIYIYIYKNEISRFTSAKVGAIGSHQGTTYHMSLLFCFYSQHMYEYVLINAYAIEQLFECPHNIYVTKLLCIWHGSFHSTP